MANRRHTATLPKGGKRPASTPATAAGRLRQQSRNAGTAVLACLLFLAAPALPAQDQDERPGMGESYLYNNLQNHETGAENASARPPQVSADELRDPSSRAWAGAQALRLTYTLPYRPLADGIIAAAGDARGAVAARADGGLRIFGPFGCQETRMPGGHPALALAMAPQASLALAWAQGSRELVSIELGSPGCAATSAPAPFSGETRLAVTSGGEYFAAHDAAGMLWLGRPGEPPAQAARIEGPLAVLDFSEAEGVLLALDENGRGGLWNPRNGRQIRSLDIAGGPFARGEFRSGQALLWRADGGLVRWDLLHGRPAQAAQSEQPTSQGLLLQDGRLLLAAAQPAWLPEPVYETAPLVLEYSREARSLRLHDVDGAVRYYDAAKGAPALQSFADDWTQLPIAPDGTAQEGGLRLRVFERIETRPGDTATDSRLYCRAVSRTLVQLWTGKPQAADIRIRAGAEAVAEGLRKPADGPLRIPLRQGLAADAPVETIELK